MHFLHGEFFGHMTEINKKNPPERCRFQAIEMSFSGALAQMNNRLSFLVFGTKTLGACSRFVLVRQKSNKSGGTPGGTCGFWALIRG
ncbi:hypothetical protein [Pseudooceanicola sp.]|uniref:hypothetical protein n=1 Tax=Pseudooceanicola sp. TaxID=1914328 RepID=UPI003515E3FD